MVIAKKVIARKIGKHNYNEKYATMGKEALEKINNLGIVPAYIAGMSVAINVCCHTARHAEGIL